MQKIRKYIIVIILLMCAIALTGCADAEINYKITKNHQVTMTYNIKIDTTNMYSDESDEIEAFLNDIKDYWKNLGYYDVIVNYDIDDILHHYIRIKLTHSEKCDSHEEAFNKLYEFMTCDLSIFDEVSFDYDKDYYKQTYKYHCTADMSNLIDMDTLSEIYPHHVTTDVEKALEDISIKVTFDLPRSESWISSDIEYENSTHNIPAIQPTDFYVTGKIYHTDNRLYEEKTLSINQMRKSDLILYGSISLGLIVLIIVLFIIKHTIKRAEKKKVPDNALDDIPDGSLDDSTP